MRLPARPRLHPGESIESYLDRLCAMNGLRPDQLQQFTRTLLRFSAWSVSPHPATLRAVARLGDVRPRDLRDRSLARTLRALLPVDASLPPGAGSAPVVLARRTWFWPGTSQVCPMCMSEHPERVWQSHWRHPLFFGCHTHGIRLHAICPSCRRPFRDAPVTRSPADATLGRLCGNPLGERGYCTQPLGSLSTQRMHPAERAATAFCHELLRGRPVTIFGHDQVAPVEAFTAVRSLVALHAHAHVSAAHGDRPRSGVRRFAISPPRETEIRSALISTATEILTSDPDGAAGMVSTMLASVRPVDGLANWVRDNTVGCASLTPVLTAALDRHSRPSSLHLSARPMPTELAQVPQLIDPVIFDTFFADATTSGREAGRAYVSLSLARAVTPTWEQAGLSLGYPAELAHKIARTGSAHLRVDAAEWKARIYRLGEVDFQPVDFRAREERVRDLGRALPILMAGDPLADRWVAWHWQNWAFGHRQLIPVRGADTPAWRHSYADFVHRLKLHPVDPPDWLDTVQIRTCSRAFR